MTINKNVDNEEKEVDLYNIFDYLILQTRFINYTKISKALNINGYKTRNDKAFNPSTIRRLFLTN